VAIASMRRDTDERQTMLEALGVLYTRGHAVEWKRIYPHESRSVPLPPYPWQRERHWVQGAALVARPKPAARDPLDECIYDVKWRRQPRAAGPATHVGAPAGGAWLLFGDRGGLAATLAAQLTARGQMAVRVVPGQRFACVEPNLYEVNLANEADYQALFQAVFGADPRCRGVVHLASLDATPWEQATVETLKRDQQTGFLSVAHAARAMLRHSFPELPRLWVVTSGVQTVASEPVKGLSQAPLWGLGRTLALEHPELACTLVDLEATPGTQGAMDLLQELSAPDAETQIALRGGVRHVARLVQSGFEAEPARTLRFEPDASYLITGGLSGLGLSLAGWMVEQGARHLALLGRRAPSAEAKTAIQAMEARGAEVLVFSADVARRDDVDRVLEDVTRRMPRLRGLVHAAGVGQEATLLEGQTESSFWPVMAPKMLGAAHLHAATKGMPLDFFVLYSSASAALGLIGQAAYAGANAGLDAMAHALRSEGVPALSIQWGAFSEVGLSARDTTGERMSRGGLESLTPRQGNEALGRLLMTSQAEVAVMRLAIQRWFVVFPQLADSPFWSELRQRDGSSQPRAAHPVERVDLEFQRSLEAATPAERLRRLALHVQQELGKVLRLDPAQLGHTDPFSGYGFDSLMGLELRNRLQTTLDIKLSMADIVTHARIDELAEFLMTRVALAPAGHGSPALVARPLEGDGAPAKLPIPGSWIVTPRPSPAARMRLFCFPYAGGSASVFGTWPAGLPSEIEVCAIQPPGRHERLHEPLPRSVEEMVAELLPVLLPYLDRPFAVFGHCLGAIVMFEVLRELAEKHGLRPEHIFVSGAPAPRKYAVPNMAMRSPEEFTDLLEFIGFTRGSVLGDEDAERHLLPAVKADFEVAARYKHIPAAPLDTSITAFAGREDVFAPPDVMSDWRDQTTSWFSKIVLPGEHYFIVPERAALLRIIGEELLLRLASLEQKRESSAPRLTTDGPRSPWLRTPAPRARPRARLFCFAGLGKSSSIYDRFPSLLGEDVEVTMIDLPGRGARTHELPLGRVDEIVDSLVPALRPHLDVPYAFFGVDVGAIVMFEAARRLRRDGAAPPSHLFVSAAMAPQEYFWAPMHHLSRERLFRGLRTLGFSLNENDANEQALRAECATMASYTHRDELPLSIPLDAFCGERDFICPAGSVRQWREQTTAAFAFHAWPGGHDLTGDDSSALLDVVREALGKPPFS
jgi:surfactin synthase thioesterase subunit/NAD(P)-dependent dehydrogenase (short-subunit alcohol dehydrogenase family)/acyl carrier protein